ncbi:hypothetical protein ACHHYP_03545 [Achlya hypogyna]|uniref:Uncharacterized protein n=1 Tax=Achlya hypogyna TaxID=1202772 RepID=A0A1V9ZR44_ACHHY|nr:hypothetical protein ACHHYP_03545 [Achlya hypogyna]
MSEEALAMTRKLRAMVVVETRGSGRAGITMIVANLETKVTATGSHLAGIAGTNRAELATDEVQARDDHRHETSIRQGKIRCAHQNPMDTKAPASINTVSIDGDQALATMKARARPSEHYYQHTRVDNKPNEGSARRPDGETNDHRWSDERHDQSSKRRSDDHGSHRHDQGARSDSSGWGADSTNRRPNDHGGHRHDHTTRNDSNGWGADPVKDEGQHKTEPEEPKMIKKPVPPHLAAYDKTSDLYWKKHHESNRFDIKWLVWQAESEISNYMAEFAGLELANISARIQAHEHLLAQWERGEDMDAL